MFEAIEGSDTIALARGPLLSGESSVELAAVASQATAGRAVAVRTGAPEVGGSPTGAWGPAAWTRLIETLAPAGDAALNAATRLLLRPHADDVLSDAQRCLTITRDHPHPAIGVLADPFACLTASMLDAASDHLERSLHALGRQSATFGVVIANVEIDPASARGLRETRFDRGLVDPELIASLVRSHVDPSKVLVFVGDGDRDAVEAFTAACAS